MWQVIVKIAKGLHERGLARFGVGIQLVQIGNNAIVSKTLKYLDDELAKNNAVWVCAFCESFSIIALTHQLCAGHC